MILNDSRIINFLDKRLKENNLDKKKFLYPQIDDLRDANNLFGMDKIVSKIKSAIENKKKILIYGDYDSDGICSTTILYLYLKSQNADVSAFIPNRFINGYGISCETIEVIKEQFNPDLLITVDLGITAIEQIEILKQEGIDVIVTDHHIPLSEIPDCALVDPKIDPDGKYGFDALCGAGVALKVVEAIAGRNEALKYLDICAIATVGDIVQLIDENRVIAKFGIEKINQGKTLPSIKFLLNKLKINELTSTDISFKVVPRLNACGRMDNAIKVFDFLIETNQEKLEEKYAEMEKDNIARLKAIESGTKIIDKFLQTYDRDEPSILVVGDFHEGVLGILASRLCHEFNKPAIVFAKDINGNLKGSGRSIEKVDIHKIISSISGMLESFGGHKMACGLDIEGSSFESFKNVFNKKIAELTKPEDFMIDESHFDIEISDDDLNENFYLQLSMLEPFGYCNEKPILALKQKQMRVEQINEKSFNHYYLHTNKNNIILGFNSYKYVNICRTESDKLIFVDLNVERYKSKRCLNVVLRSIKLLNATLPNIKNQDLASALYNKYYSIFDYNNKEKYHISNNICEIVKQKFSENEYGTIVVASTNLDIVTLQNSGININKYISSEPMKNGQNVIVASTKQIFKLKDVKGYKNIIFMHKYFDEEHLYFSQLLDTYETEKLSPCEMKILKDREIFVRVYKLISGYTMLKSNDIMDFVEKMSIKDKTISMEQIMFCLIVFLELNFFEFDENTNVITIQNSKKMELTSSKFYNQVV